MLLIATARLFYGKAELSLSIRGGKKIPKFTHSAKFQKLGLYPNLDSTLESTLYRKLCQPTSSGRSQGNQLRTASLKQLKNSAGF